MKSWNTTRTGMVFHSFKTDGTAVCRGNIRHAEGTELFTEEQIDARLAEAWGARVRGFRKCDSCSGLEAKAAARAEASMQPSADEGDYLPPAEGTNAPAATRTHHYNSSGGQRFIAGRGWVNHCRVCQAAEGTGDHFHNTTAPQNNNKEDSLPINSGPLTERQITIIGHVRAGLRYKQIASRTGLSEPLIHHEAAAIQRKLKAATMPCAVNAYATAEAYLKVADVLDGTGREHPQQDGVAEDHVDRVLKMLAAIYRDRAARLLPQ